MIRALLATLCLIVTALLPGSALAGELAGLASVIDGDTIEIRGPHIRLFGSMTCFPTRDCCPPMAFASGGSASECQTASSAIEIRPFSRLHDRPLPEPESQRPPDPTGCRGRAAWSRWRRIARRRLPEAAVVRWRGIAAPRR